MSCGVVVLQACMRLDRLFYGIFVLITHVNIVESLDWIVPFFVEQSAELEIP